MGTFAISSLSPAEKRDLQHVARAMIPASEDYGVPAADDATIFADILQSLDRDLDDVRTALADLVAFAGGSFADLDVERAETVVRTFLASFSPAVAVLGRVVLQCYYRDDRVLRSLGMEPRPPFPMGHTLEQGDWTLLDEVRGRPKLWRDDTVGSS